MDEPKVEPKATEKPNETPGKPVTSPEKATTKKKSLPPAAIAGIAVVVLLAVLILVGQVSLRRAVQAEQQQSVNALSVVMREMIVRQVPKNTLDRVLADAAVAGGYTDLIVVSRNGDLLGGSVQPTADEVQALAGADRARLFRVQGDLVYVVPIELAPGNQIGTLQARRPR